MAQKKKMIHSGANIHKGSTIEDNVSIGDGSVIGENVQIGEGSTIEDNVRLDGNVKIGKNVHLHRGVTIGPPQHISFKDFQHSTNISNNSILREFVTVHGSTTEIPTKIGKDCYLMAFSHVGHDCKLENNVILTNFVQLGGHVKIRERAVVGGGTMIHQRMEIGERAMVGAMIPILKSVPPYSMVAETGKGIKIVSINRRGMSDDLSLRKNAVQAMKVLKTQNDKKTLIDELDKLSNQQALILKKFIDSNTKYYKWD